MGDDGSRTGQDDRLGRLFDHLDLLGDLDDIGAGGNVGAGAGLEVAADALFRGPDDALDAIEGATDLGDAVDDLF